MIGGGPTILFRGVDLSGYDARAGVDYKQLYNAGYRFAWVKIGEGTNFINAFWRSQIAGLIAAGFTVGGYWFCQPGDGAHQADLMVAAGCPIGPGYLPPIMDLEVSGLNVAFAAAFTARMYARTGVLPGSYSSRSYFQTTLAGGRGWERPGQLRWIAAYGGSGPGIACDVWQDSSSRQPPGTHRQTDTDASYVPMSKLVVGAAGGSTVSTEGSDVSMVALDGGRVAVVVRGTDKRIYSRVVGADGEFLTDWTRVGSAVVASSVDACTRTGNDLWIVALDPADRSVLIFKTEDAMNPAATIRQDLGGTGSGGAPGIAPSTPSGVLVSVAGTAPHAGEIYLNRWDGSGWSGWQRAGGVAG